MNHAPFRHTVALQLKPMAPTMGFPFFGPPELLRRSLPDSFADGTLSVPVPP